MMRGVKVQKLPASRKTFGHPHYKRTYETDDTCCPAGKPDYISAPCRLRIFLKGDLNE